MPSSAGWGERAVSCDHPMAVASTPNLPTNIMDFTGFDSSIILILRGGIPRPIGNFPDNLSQAILVGVMLVGRLGVFSFWRSGLYRRGVLGTPGARLWRSDGQRISVASRNLNSPSFNARDKTQVWSGHLPVSRQKYCVTYRVARSSVMRWGWFTAPWNAVLWCRRPRSQLPATAQKATGVIV